MNTYHEHSPSPNPTSFDAFALEYTKVRDGLPEQVRKPLDVLREEVMEICRAHGVDHPSKLVTPEAKATTKTLERVQELLEQIHYIFEHKEVPLGHKDWEVKIPEGQEVSQVVEKNGKVAIVTSDVDSFCHIFDSSGIPLSLPLGRIEQDLLTIIDDDVVCAWRKVATFTSGIFVNGEILAPSAQNFVQVEYLLEMNGKVVYVAQKVDEGREKIYVNGVLYGSPEGYFKVSHIIPVGDELAFVAQQNATDPFHIYVNGLLSDQRKGLGRVVSLDFIDGEVVYIERTSLGDRLLGERSGLIYASSENLKEVQKINGQMSWIEYSSWRATWFLNREAQGNCFDILSVVETKGKPVLVVRDQERDPITFIQGGETIGKKEGYKMVMDVICVGDEIVFIAGDGEKSWWIESSSGACFGFYETIHEMKPVDDKHFIVISEEDGKVVQRTFDIDHPPYQGEGVS